MAIGCSKWETHDLLQHNWWVESHLKKNLIRSDIKFCNARLSHYGNQSRGYLIGGRLLWPPAVPQLAARSSQSNPRGSGPEVLKRERGHVTAETGVAEVGVFRALLPNVTWFSRHLINNHYLKSLITKENLKKHVRFWLSAVCAVLLLVKQWSLPGHLQVQYWPQNKMVNIEKNKSMAECKKEVTPVLTHWSHVSFALSHWDNIIITLRAPQSSTVSTSSTTTSLK